MASCRVAKTHVNRQKFASGFRGLGQRSGLRLQDLKFARARAKLMVALRFLSGCLISLPGYVLTVVFAHNQSTSVCGSRKYWLVV